MIKVTQTLTISGGKAPYSFTIKNVNGCSCLSINPSVDNNIQAGEYPIEFTFDTNFDPNCIANCQVEAEVIDADGCVKIVTIPITNPCTALPALTISSSNDLEFVATSVFALYTWSYSTDIFELDDNDANPTNNRLKLKLKTLPTQDLTTTISVIAEHENGCTLTASYDYTICKPKASDTTITLEKGINNCAVTLDLTTLVVPCPTGAIDFSTVDINGDINVVITKVTDSQYTISSNNTGSTTGTITFTVKDNLGRETNIGTITVLIDTDCCDLPVAVDYLGDNRFCLGENSSVQITLPTGYTYAISEQPVQGTAFLVGNVITYNSVSNPTNKSLFLKYSLTNTCGTVEGMVQIEVVCSGTINVATGTNVCV